MLNKAPQLKSLTWSAALVICVTLLITPAAVLAKQEVVPVDGAAYSVGSSIQDNLKTFTGKKVYLTLASGKNLAGIVKDVGNHLLHLEKIEGKEYFDALIRIDSVIAIDARFRQFQR